jgi:hypothetical protein
MDFYVASIDAHLSLAVAADTFQLLTKPTLTTNLQKGALRLTKARNLLTEFQQGTFDPLNI